MERRVVSQQRARARRGSARRASSSVPIPVAAGSSMTASVHPASARARSSSWSRRASVSRRVRAGRRGARVYGPVSTAAVVGGGSSPAASGRRHRRSPRHARTSSPSGPVSPADQRLQERARRIGPADEPVGHEVQAGLELRPDGGLDARSFVALGLVGRQRPRPVQHREHRRSLPFAGGGPRCAGSGPGLDAERPQDRVHREHEQQARESRAAASPARRTPAPARR